MGIGVDNVDFQAAERLRIPIRNTPGMFNDEVADLALDTGSRLPGKRILLTGK